jgi:hypothetical protein
MEFRQLLHRINLPVTPRFQLKLKRKGTGTLAAIPQKCECRIYSIQS